MTMLSAISLQAYFMFVLFGDPLAKKKKVGGGDQGLAPLTTWETAKLAGPVFILYFWLNYFSTISFGLTSAGSASILASTCGFFTLVFGRIMGVEKLSFMKVVAVLISVGGVIVLGISEFKSVDNRMLGNAFAILGAALYGVNSVYLKRATVDESRISMLTLFAFVGFYNLLFSWIGLLVFHFTGLEVFELPPSREIILYLIVNIVFGSLIPNYMWNVAFLYTSPLVVAIGLSFTIPLTLIIERDITSAKLASAACITLGFGIVNMVEIYPSLDISFGKKDKN